MVRNSVKNKKVPMRKCVGCQEMKNKKEMIRIVRTEEDVYKRQLYGCGDQPGRIYTSRPL